MSESTTPQVNREDIEEGFGPVTMMGRDLTTVEPTPLVLFAVIGERVEGFSIDDSWRIVERLLEECPDKYVSAITMDDVSGEMDEDLVSLVADWASELVWDRGRQSDVGRPVPAQELPDPEEIQWDYPGPGVE